MSHYDIDFSFIEDEEVRKREALIAAIQYLGLRRAKLWFRAAKECSNPDTWCVVSSFAGVQGYPAAVVWKKYHEEGFTV
jgi:hypothetical protein